MKQVISTRVRELMIEAGMFSGTMNPVPTFDKFADLLIRDCINSACLAELDKKNISREMMSMYYLEITE